MSETKHTAGEWVINPTIKSEVRAGSIAIEQHFRGRVEQGELWANARLIAAAPDLLEACQGMVDAYGNCECVEGAPKNHCPWCICRTAIAKAEGRV